MKTGSVTELCQATLKPEAKRKIHKTDLGLEELKDPSINVILWPCVLGLGESGDTLRNGAGNLSRPWLFLQVSVICVSPSKAQ